MPNRLEFETSPYLLQHANNPVDWYPWCDDSLNRAQNEDKPIFLSIGYSACHWCHVMEHESFEDEKIAEFLNRHFINIKVDREERPDLDHIYMQTVMALRGGQGGWPLSAFLTPERHVFFGGTYWPPRERVGMPGFESVIRQVHQAFLEQREAIDQQGRQVTQWLVDSIQSSSETNQEINSMLLADASRRLHQHFDFENGGFGSAPKFPHPMDIQLLLRLATSSRDLRKDVSDAPSHEQMLEMVKLNLDKMAYGGIHDHLGGGFYRYSVDAEWLIPHFEKMLYDNAQLLRLYTESYLATGNQLHRRIADKIVEYLLRDMLDEAGGFHSSEDADSEGEEGKFYVWTPSEVEAVLGKEPAELFCQLYDVTESGNFEGKNNLNLKTDFGSFAQERGLDKDDLQIRIRESRQKLMEARNRRVRPGLDDKILCSWNALALDAIAFYATATSNEKVRATVHANRQFALEKMNSEAGNLLHSFRHGQVKIDAFLDDFAYLIHALCTQSTPFENIERAAKLAQTMIDQFWDEKDGGFFYTKAEQTDVIARYKDHHDGSIPSGNGMAALALLKLSQLTGDPTWQDFAERTIRWALPFVKKSPLACGQMLLAIDYLLAVKQEWVLILGDSDESSYLWVEEELGKTWRPYATIVVIKENQLRDSKVIDDSVKLGKSALDGAPTLYACSGGRCDAPVSGVDAIKKKLNA